MCRLKEKDHIKEVLSINGYEAWALNIPDKTTKKNTEKNVNTDPNSAPKKFPVPLPYVNGLSEELQRIFKDHGVATYHKPGNTLRSILVKPKDKSNTAQICNCVYNITCKDCQKHYIGETARTMEVRFKEHLNPKRDSAIQDHIAATGHNFDFSDIKIVGREEKFFARKYREAIKIYQQKPAINRDQGIEIPPVMLQLAAKTPTQRQSTH